MHRPPYAVQRGKRLTLLALASAIISIVFVAVAGRNRIIEHWWISKLMNGETIESLDAAQKLASVRSVVALPLLLRAYSQRSDLRYILSARRICDRGNEAAFVLARLMEDSDHSVRWASAFLIGQIGSDGQEARDKLVRMTRDPWPGVRAAAVAALAKLDRAPVSLRKEERMYPDGIPTSEEYAIITIVKQALAANNHELGHVSYQIAPAEDGWSIRIVNISSGSPRYSFGYHSTVLLDRSGKGTRVIHGP
jgi:hypothetical protein